MRTQVIVTRCTYLPCRDYRHRRFEFVYKPEHMEDRCCWACRHKLDVTPLKLTKAELIMRLEREGE